MIANLEMIKCSRCKGQMPKLRLDKFGYDFCVTCSDVKPKVGRVRVVGEGDHTITEMDILDQDVAKRLQAAENTARGVRNVPLEVLNYDEDEILDSDTSIKSSVTKMMKDDEDDEDIEEDDQEELEVEEELELEE